ncbi:Pyrethroid hydrolase [Alphaproteobacteria bacterium SO-S41]|nr:Pyrethroid hydrolase [Alphaproteobacteria bacterium SO-S41]
MTHILLVHGAWHGAWCWYKTIPALQALGLTPHTIDLPGHGLATGGTQTLAAYAEAVAAKLQTLPEPAVLLGHSMGGQVISAAAELAPERIKTLVYLCAFLPRTGESIFANAAGDSATLLGQYMVPLEDGRVVIKDEGLKPAFYADCLEEDVALARLLLVPQSAEPFQAAATLSHDRFGSVRRSYIICKQDKAIGAATQRGMIARSPVSDTVELDTSHSPFFSAPDKLAAAIKDVLE